MVAKKRTMKRLKPMPPAPSQACIDALVAAAHAAKDTLDTLRTGKRFTFDCYELGYARLRNALLPFNQQESSND